MNIYTHPKEIRATALMINNSNLVAWTIGNNYHMIDCKIYSVWYEGCGNFPELCDSIPDNAYYINCPVKHTVSAIGVFGNGSR